MKFRWTFIAVGLYLLLTAHAPQPLSWALAKIDRLEADADVEHVISSNAVSFKQVTPLPSNQTPTFRAADVITLRKTAEAAAELAQKAEGSAEALAQAVAEDRREETTKAQARAEALAQAADAAQDFAMSVSTAKAEVDAHAEALAQAAALAKAQAEASAQAAAQAEVRVNEEFSLVVKAAEATQAAASASAGAAADAAAQAEDMAKTAVEDEKEANARASSRAQAAASAADDAFNDASASATAFSLASASARAVDGLRREAQDDAEAAETKIAKAEEEKTRVIEKTIRPQIPCVDVETKVEGALTAVGKSVSEASASASASAQAVGEALAIAEASASAAGIAVAQAEGHATAAASAAASAEAEASAIANAWSKATAEASAKAEASAAASAVAQAQAEAAAKAQALVRAEFQVAVEIVTTAHAEAESSARAAGEAAAQATAQAEAASHAMAEAVSQAEASAHAIAEAAAQAQAEATALAEALASAEASASASASAAAEASASALAAANAAVEAANTEDVSELIAQVAIAVDAAAQASADAQATAEAVVEVNVAVFATADAIAKAQATAVVEAQASAETFAQAQAEATALAQATAEAQADASAEAYAAANAAVDARAQVSAHAEAATTALADAQAKATASASAQAKAQVAVTVSANAIAQAEAEAAAQANTQATAAAQATALAQASATAKAVAFAQANAAAKVEVAARAQAAAAARAFASTEISVDIVGGIEASTTATVKPECLQGTCPRLPIVSVNAVGPARGATVDVSGDIPVNVTVTGFESPPNQATPFNKTTPFSKAVAKGTQVILVTPLTVTVNNRALTFSEWQRNGTSFSSDARISLTLGEQNESLTAVYLAQPTRLPDLVVATAEFSPPNPTPNSNVSFTIRVSNQGQGDAGAFSVSIGETTANARQSRLLTGLSAGASTTLTFIQSVGTTTRDFVVEVDPDNHVVESNEDNNRATVRVPVAAALPDLTFSEVSYAPQDLAVGTSFTVQATVINAGVGNAGPFAVELRSGSTVLQTRNINALPAQSTVRIVFSSRTLGATRENYTVVVDPGERVQESNENNNQASLTVTGRQPELPDLVVTASASPDTATPNANVSFTVTVRNQGRGNAGAFSVSISDTVTTTNQESRNVTGLSASATTTLTFIRPMGTTSRDFLVVVDPDNRVAESNEDNNRATVRVSLAAALPDLTVSATRSPSGSPQIGTSLTFDVTVRNQGGGDAGSFNVEVRSPNGVAIQGVSSVRAGAATSFNLTRPCASASETFTITVDPDNRVQESNENNNRTTLNVSCQQAPQPQHLTWDYGTLRGGTFTVASRTMPSDLANNIGTLGAQQSQLRSSTLPSGITFSLDLAKRSASLTGTLPNTSVTHELVYDLLNSSGQKVADLTITIVVTGNATTCCTLTFEAIADSGTSQTPISVPISLGGCTSGSRNTPFTTDCTQGATISVQAPSSSTTGGLSLAFQHWLSNGVVLTTNASFSGTVNRTETLTAVYRGSQPTTSPCNTEFSGSSLDPAFTSYLPVVGPTFSLAANPGHLRLDLPLTGAGVSFDHWNTVDRAPQLRCTAPSGDWELTTKMQLLQVTEQDDFHVGLMVAFSQFDLFYWGFYRGSELRLERSGTNDLLHTTPSCRTVSCASAEVELMIAKNGNTYSFSYRFSNSNNWTLVGSQKASQAPQFVGLIGKTWSATRLVADFDYVHVQVN